MALPLGPRNPFFSPGGLRGENYFSFIPEHISKPDYNAVMFNVPCVVVGALKKEFDKLKGSKRRMSVEVIIIIVQSEQRKFG